MDRDDNRARGDRSLSEPGGSSFGHVQLSDALGVCEAKAVGAGVKFRHRIGGTAATDDRPHEPREPQWTSENRPVVDGAKPASGRAAPSASVLPQSNVIEQVAVEPVSLARA